MADYIFIRKSRNALSSFLHIALNLTLGIGSIFITYFTHSWIPGIILVLISKWRIFAVRPRFWLLNIKSSLVDLIVGSSFIFLAYCSGTALLPIHYILAAGYSLWLIFLKPRSSERATETQALTAVFLGSTAATLMSANANPIILPFACFIIGYGAARHVLIQAEDTESSLIATTAGLLAAEVAWLSRSWLIVYSLSNIGIILPQLSIILTLLAFAFGTAYKSALHHKGKLKLSDVAMPIIFTVLIISIVIIWFSQPKFNL